MKARRLKKIVDDSTEIRCAAGFGFVREEVWIDEAGQVARYNLAFIQHQLFGKDNGRVLGYDNAHGVHHRHFKGTVEEIEFRGYDAVLNRFIDELQVLRKEKR